LDFTEPNHTGRASGTQILTIDAALISNLDQLQFALIFKGMSHGARFPMFFCAISDLVLLLSGRTDKL
jgi:hypothetical protein